jgi:hypothetical protein
MRQQTASRIAWSIGGLAVAVSVAGFGLQIATPQESLPAHIRTSLAGAGR